MIKIENLSNENIIHIQKNGVEYIQFKKLLEYKNLIHCFTLKPLDFASNNNYKEKQETVNFGLKKLKEEFNIQEENICRPKQTHTDKVEIINEDDQGIYNSKFDDVDGLVTKNKEKFLMLAFADCTPLLFYDPVKNIIANTHSGWMGTYKEIAVKTIEKMHKEYECNEKDIICCIGPHIRKCHFEVDEDVKEMFKEKFKNSKNIDTIISYNSVSKKYYIDTTKINKQILIDAGLEEKNIIDSKICTVCDSNICHSFRVEKENSGRSVAIIGLI